MNDLENILQKINDNNDEKIMEYLLENEIKDNFTKIF